MSLEEKNELGIDKGIHLVKARIVGSSMVITIPKDIRDKYDVMEDDLIALIPYDTQRIILRLIEQNRYNSLLKDFSKQIEGDTNRPLYIPDMVYKPIQSNRFELIKNDLAKSTPHPYILHYDHKVKHYILFYTKRYDNEAWLGGYISKVIAEKIKKTDKLPEILISELKTEEEL